MVTNLMQDQSRDSQPVTTSHRHHVRDSLSRVTLASILVLAGLVFFADNMGYLPSIRDASPWNWVMLGAGGLLLLENVVRVFSVDHHSPHLWGIILGFVLLSMGLGAIFGVDLWRNWWPVVLIALGLSAIARAMRR
jgi:hypothetical protein